MTSFPQLSPLGSQQASMGGLLLRLLKEGLRSGDSGPLSSHPVLSVCVGGGGLAWLPGSKGCGTLLCLTPSLHSPLLAISCSASAKDAGAGCFPSSLFCSLTEV